MLLRAWPMLQRRGICWCKTVFAANRSGVRLHATRLRSFTSYIAYRLPEEEPRAALEVVPRLDTHSYNASAVSPNPLSQDRFPGTLVNVIDTKRRKELWTKLDQAEQNWLLMGPGGCGKSHALVHFVMAQRAKGNVVLYINNMVEWVAQPLRYLLAELEYAIDQSPLTDLKSDVLKNTVAFVTAPCLLTLPRSELGLLLNAKDLRSLLEAAEYVPLARQADAAIRHVLSMVLMAAKRAGKRFIAIFDQEDELWSRGLQLTFPFRLVLETPAHLTVVCASANNEGFRRHKTGWMTDTFHDRFTLAESQEVLVNRGLALELVQLAFKVTGGVPFELHELMRGKPTTPQQICQFAADREGAVVKEFRGFLETLTECERPRALAATQYLDTEEEVPVMLPMPASASIAHEDWPLTNSQITELMMNYPGDYGKLLEFAVLTHIKARPIGALPKIDETVYLDGVDSVPTAGCTRVTLFVPKVRTYPCIDFFVYHPTESVLFAVQFAISPETKLSPKPHGYTQPNSSWYYVPSGTFSAVEWWLRVKDTLLEQGGFSALQKPVKCDLYILTVLKERPVSTSETGVSFIYADIQTWDYHH